MRENQKMKRITFMRKKSGILLAIILPVLLIGSNNIAFGQKAWSQVSSPTSNDLEAVTYYDQTGTLIAVGDRIVLRSTDLGRTWKSVNTTSVHFYDVQFSKNGKGHAVGSNAYRIHSTDDGATWKTDGFTGSTVYYASAFPNTYVQGEYGTGLIVGSSSSPDITTDDGATWATSSGSLTINKNYFGADFDGFRMLIVGGSGEIWKSDNLGQKWTKVSSGVSSQLRSVSSAYNSLSSKYVCGNNGVALKSSDGGDSWTNISPAGVQTNLNSIIYVGSKILMVGQGGAIMSSANGGSTWQNEKSSTTNDLNSVVETKNGDLVAVGKGGTILLYSNIPQGPFGGTAAVIPGKVEAENYDLGGNNKAYYDDSNGNQGGYFRNDDVDVDTCMDAGGGYYVGWIDTGEWIDYTVDVQTSGTYTAIARVASALSNGKLKIIFNGADFAERTIPNTGDWLSWTNVNFGQFSLKAGTNVLRLFCSVQAYNINYIDIQSGVTEVNNINILPTEFELSQNYPNPFNPNTTISYSVPKSSNVKLEVYNTVGQKVSTLVNTHQEAGVYTVNFNTSAQSSEGYNLTSGIYFFRFTSRDDKNGMINYSQTKKMILLK